MNEFRWISHAARFPVIVCRFFSFSNVDKKNRDRLFEKLQKKKKKKKKKKNISFARFWRVFLANLIFFFACFFVREIIIL